MKSKKTEAGVLDGRNLRVAVASSRFNYPVSERLLDGALKALWRCGVPRGQCDVFRVPGSFELLGAAKWAVECGRYDAVVCLGVIIKGETSHHEHLAGAVSMGLGMLAASSRVPVAFGVLTTDTVEQAEARTSDQYHKGGEAAEAAVEMAGLAKKILSSGVPRVAKRKRASS